MKNIKLFLLISISIFLGFFSAISLSQIEIKKIEFDKEKKIDTEATNEEFIRNIISRVKKDYVEEKTDDELSKAAASGILSSLDPHSAYLDEKSLKEMQVQTKGEFGGVGIEITMDMMVVKVVAAIDDTPASEAGIKSGDYITRVDGKSIIGNSLTEVVKVLRGKPGTSVLMTILRKGEKAPLDIKVTREVIKIKAVKSAKFKNVAYVKINSFSAKAHDDLVKSLKKEIQEIGKENLEGFILDLRNNPGGLLDQAIKVSDVFLDKGQKIVSIKGRSQEEIIYQDKEDEQVIKNIPMVVLINEGSASASEIVSGALQDHKRAVVMGVKSFGKGSVQTIIPLENNHGALKLTTSLYYTPNGKSIQAHGIEPDIEVLDAKIEKSEKSNRDSEADLQNHIEVQLQEEIRKAKKDKMSDEDFEIYKEDYQLARALDLVRGVSIYKAAVK
jgi:carboxyl-terminal processing protease